MRRTFGSMTKIHGAAGQHPCARALPQGLAALTWDCKSWHRKAHHPLNNYLKSQHAVTDSFKKLFSLNGMIVGCLRWAQHRRYCTRARGRVREGEETKEMNKCRR